MVGDRQRGELVLFVKEGCHLCAMAQAMLVPLSAQSGRVLRVVDLRCAETAAVRFADRVPVLTADGAELCWGRFSERDVRLVLGLEEAPVRSGWWRQLLRRWQR